MGRRSDRDRDKVGFAELGEQLHFATSRHAEQHPAAATDHLARLHSACQHEARRRSAYIQPAGTSARFGERRFRDANAGIGGVTSRNTALDIRLGDETARDERLSPLQFLLRKASVGAGYVDLGCQLGAGLCLHRAIDDRQDLARADPLARLDKNPDDLAAFSGDADRHFAARCESARGRNRTIDRLPAGNCDRHGRRRCAALAVGTARGRGFFAAAEHEEGHRKGDDEHAGGDEDHPAAARPVDDDQSIGTSEGRGFPVHSHVFRLVRESYGCSASVYYANNSVAATEPLKLPAARVFRQTAALALRRRVGPHCSARRTRMGG